LWKLRIHFVSFCYVSELALIISSIRRFGFNIMVVVHIFLAVSLTLLYHYGLKLREAIARLPDKDLENFLVETLFKGVMKTAISVLFLTFRTTKCMFEKGSLGKCVEVSHCSTFISVYLIIWWGTKLVQASVRSEWRKELNLSIENIARMRDISFRRAAQGFLTMVTGICGIFLFSMMSADEMDKTTTVVVGGVGLTASFGVVISEIHTSLKAQNRRLELSESGEILNITVNNEEPVKECSWVFVGLSFLSTSTYSAFCGCYAVSMDEKYMFMAYLILPIIALSFMMAVMYKPKRTDAGYKRFLHFHFFSGPIFSEIGSIVGLLRAGWISNGLFAMLRIPCYYLIFWLGLKLRKLAAELPPQELSNFLCQTVLLKGAAAMGTMLFFSFETLSCFISQNSLDNGQCENTSMSALLLSVYLVVITTLSMNSKAVPKSVQREMAWELSTVATLKGLRWWQQLQGGLITFTAVSSLYLLSVLGVEKDYDKTIGSVGSLGFVSLLIACLIGITMLVRTKNVHQRNNKGREGNVEMLKDQKSQGFSSGDIQDSAFIATLV